MNVNPKTAAAVLAVAVAVGAVLPLPGGNGAHPAAVHALAVPAAQLAGPCEGAPELNADTLAMFFAPAVDNPDPAPPTPTPDATDAATWKEPHLAPVLEALGYTPSTCPDGERLAVDRLLSSAHRRGATKGLVIEAARRVADRSQVTDRRRVAELQLELDAMAVVGVVS